MNIFHKIWRWFRVPRYRIVEDESLGYQVQAKRLWFPFWIEVALGNTHSDKESAIKYAKQHAKRYQTYHYLGRLDQ